MAPAATRVHGSWADPAAAAASRAGNPTATMAAADLAATHVQIRWQRRCHRLPVKFLFFFPLSLDCPIGLGC
uniref:Uncharacterized protein n=1 Tax=Oryza barthii TaxID=65489 RepID=A0A679BAX7_9ORYZ|nr:hypothetical protein [Oryza barthii]